MEKFEEINKIHWLCGKYNIQNYSIDSNGLVDVKYDVHIAEMDLYNIPIKFGRIGGNFDCSNNRIETLINGPTYVKGFYHCHQNNLKDMYGFPESFFGKYLWANDNPVFEIIKIVVGIYEFRGLTDMQVSNLEKKRIDFIQLLNDNTVIRNGNSIIKSRLEECLYDLKEGNIIDKLDKIKFKHYKLI